MKHRTSVCSIDGCEAQSVCRSWCDKHYTRYKRHGDPLHVTQIDTRGMSIEDKLLAHGYDETETGCWIWRGVSPGQRYGKLSLREAGEHVYRSVHRLAYECWVGPIPEGWVVRHRCDVTQCINPEHLEVGTYADNSGDMVVRGRQRDQRGEKHNMSKLTWTDVDNIRRTYYAGGITQSELGARYGVTQSQISAITRGVRWKAGH